MAPVNERLYRDVLMRLGPFGMRRLCLALADNRNLRYLACEFGLTLWQVRVIDQWLPAMMAVAVRQCERIRSRGQQPCVILRLERPAA